MVWLIGVLEASAGMAALLAGGAAAWIVGFLYAAFALVVLRAVVVGSDSCGCFGRLDAPPSLIHVVGNLALAAVSFAAAAGASSPPAAALVRIGGEVPAVGVGLAAAIVLVAGLILVAFTALAEALAARSGRPGGAGVFRALPPPATTRAVSLNGSGRR